MMTSNDIKQAYIELWNHVENGTIADEFFFQREQFKALVQTEEKHFANHVCDLSVIDPDSLLPVEVSVYKDQESGGMFAVDSSFLITLSDEDPVIDPFRGLDVMLVDETVESLAQQNENSASRSENVVYKNILPSPHTSSEYIETPDGIKATLTPGEQQQLEELHGLLKNHLRDRGVHKLEVSIGDVVFIDDEGNETDEYSVGDWEYRDMVFVLSPMGYLHVKAHARFTDDYFEYEVKAEGA